MKSSSHSIRLIQSNSLKNKLKKMHHFKSNIRSLMKNILTKSLLIELMSKILQTLKMMIQALMRMHIIWQEGLIWTKNNLLLTISIRWNSLKIRQRLMLLFKKCTRNSMRRMWIRNLFVWSMMTVILIRKMMTTQSKKMMVTDWQGSWNWMKNN